MLHVCLVPFVFLLFVFLLVPSHSILSFLDLYPLQVGICAGGGEMGNEVRSRRRRGEAAARGPAVHIDIALPPACQLTSRGLNQGVIRYAVRSAARDCGL